MKKRFTRILAAFALLVGLTIPLGMWGQTTATDVIDNDATASNLGNTGTTAWATNFSITGSSGAVYYIHSMGTKNTDNALQWNANGFLYMTTSSDGNKLKSVTITTTANKNVNLYAQNTPYSAAPSGTALTTIAATQEGTTYTFESDYTYLALKGTASSTSIINITIEWESTGGSAIPSLSVSPSSVDFGSVAINPSSAYTKTFDVTFANLTENLTIAGFTGITVSPTSIAYNATSPQTVTVSYNPTTVSELSGNIIVSNTEDEVSETVEVTGSAYDPNNVPIYTLYSGNLVEGDYVIYYDGKAMKNTVTSNRLDYVEVTPSSNTITNPAASIVWHIAPDGEYWTIYNMAVSKYAASTSAKNQATLVSSVNDNARWTKAGTYDFENLARSNGSDPNNKWLRNNEAYGFACYASGTGGALSLYKLASTDPDINVNQNIQIEYTAQTGVEIPYSIINPVSGTTISAASSTSWISNVTVGDNVVTFNAAENTENTDREGTITLTYGTLTKEVTVTQAAAPVIYNTIPALFAAATSTSTGVFVTFGGWVVSGTSHNGYNVFVTDGTNGFIINGEDHGFVAGNTITSTTPIACNLQLKNGYAQITGITASTEGLTIGTGTVTVADIEMANLVGVNTGALVSYNNLTCSVSTSGNYTNYDLSDGTTTIRAYGSIFSDYDDYLEDGKTYNITGVYQQYNTNNSQTKEILPRSAADIVEVVSTEPNTVTSGTLTHVSISGLWDGDTFDDITLGDEVEEGKYVYFSLTVEEGYTLESVSVLNANNNEVTLTEASESWYFIMPNSSVTINATATLIPVPPVTGDKYKLYTGALVEGDYLIVYDGGAMNTTVTSDRLQYEEVTATNNVIVTDNAAIVWHIAPSGEYWTIYSADANAYAASNGKNKAQMLDEGTDDRALWTVTGSLEYEFENKARAAATSNPENKWLRRNGTYGFACYASATGGALSLYKKVPTLDITGYGTSTGGYYLIASPVSTTPDDAGMITDELGAQATPETATYDLYYFDQAQSLEWINYRQGGFNTIEPGKGYLYANKNNVTLTFAGEAYDGDGYIELTYEDGAEFAGWNLIGNPFGTEATLDKPYFRLVEGATELTAADESAPVNAMEGVFVSISTVDLDPETGLCFAKFTTASKSSQHLALNLSRNERSASVIDRAIVRFDGGLTLPKFQLNPNNTKIYVTEGNKDYAIVRSAAEAEMPVSFRASENGTYTLAVEAENVEMNYLHLIDNLTGMDVDLLQTPSYTFEAKTSDYASRFRLVFKANGTNENNAETFAYFNGTNWTVSNVGDATLQVVDVTGRTVANQMINGNAELNLNQPAGVYVIRLVNGDNVKTQKVVVR